MSKQSKSKHRRRRKTGKSQQPVEDRRAEALTVAWMLATVATLGAVGMGALVQTLLAFADSASKTLAVFPGLMLFTATITGLLCLMMTPLVYRFRRVPPPTGVTALAVTISILPVVIHVMMSLQ